MKSVWCSNDMHKQQSKNILYISWMMHRTAVDECIHHFSWWIFDLTFYRFVWINTLRWHVYCLRSFDFSCLPFRPFYLNWLWLSSSKMKHRCFFLLFLILSLNFSHILLDRWLRGDGGGLVVSWEWLNVK